MIPCRKALQKSPRCADCPLGRLGSSQCVPWGRRRSGQIPANWQPGPARRGRRATCTVPGLDFDRSLGLRCCRRRGLAAPAGVCHWTVRFDVLLAGARNGAAPPAPAGTRGGVEWRGDCGGGNKKGVPRWCLPWRTAVSSTLTRVRQPRHL
jgi:hypothetical protein